MTQPRPADNAARTLANSLISNFGMLSTEQSNIPLQWVRVSLPAVPRSTTRSHRSRFQGPHAGSSSGCNSSTRLRSGDIGSLIYRLLRDVSVDLCQLRIGID